MFDALLAEKHLREHAENIELTDGGRAFVREFRIDVAALESARRPLCKSCLDWSVRRTHLAGSLGAAYLDRFRELGWGRKADRFADRPILGNRRKKVPVPLSDFDRRSRHVTLSRTMPVIVTSLARSAQRRSPE